MICRTYLTMALASSLALATTSSCIIAVGNDRSVMTPKASPEAMSPTLGGKLYTSAWIQRSAEYKALCHQAYNIATERLLAATARGGHRWAIVTDIDETIVDNSANSVHQALKGEDFTQASWDKWCDQASAIALAGAVDFFRKADSLGVQIFYISNRDEVNRAGTLRNLRSLGLPQADDQHLMLRDASRNSDKTARRSAVLQQYEILMLLGDNLGDFDHVFDSKQEQTREAAVAKLSREFGRRFIVLPNPNYGTWEPAMNGGYLPLKERDKKLPQLLRSHP